MALKRPKDKGTKGETELVVKLAELGISVRRTPPGCKWDLERDVPMDATTPAIEVLAIRPDRGEWLVTMDLEDFAALYHGEHRPKLRVEVKRFATSRIHTIWKEKFGA